MSSFNSIVSGMKKIRDPGKYPSYDTTTFATQGSPGIKSVMYKGTVQGEKNEYPVYVQFRGVEFAEEAKPGFIPYEKGDVTGNKTIGYYEVPDLNRNDVALKCMCTDFRFMWEFPLYKAKALIGQFRKYVKVPGSNRPPKNPENILGVCKHVWSFTNALKEAGLVK